MAQPHHGILHDRLQRDPSKGKEIRSANHAALHFWPRPVLDLAYLGSARDTNPLDNRLMELQQILTLAQKHQLNLATIDVRFGLRPVYTLKNS
jgi:hypothetical protein